MKKKASLKDMKKSKEKGKMHAASREGLGNENAAGPPSLVVYWSSVSGSLVTKRQQQHIFDALQAHRIPYQAVDVASTPDSGAVKAMLREQSPRGIALPQLWVQGKYRADYAAFVDALEGDYLGEELCRDPTPPLDSDNGGDSSNGLLMR